MLQCSSESSSFPTLIGLDKLDIVEIARILKLMKHLFCLMKIAAQYSCLNIQLQPKLEDIIKSEELLEVDSLIERAAENMKVTIIE